MAELYPSAPSPDLREPFLAKVDEAQNWLREHEIDFRFMGSLATSAYIDGGEHSINFNRQDAYTKDQRVPDLDLLVPQDDIPAVRAYRDELMSDEDFPVDIDLYIASCYIDFRPREENSYLTHKKLRTPVSNDLFAPTEQPLLGHPITTVDARTIFHSYVTAGGMLRDKDVPRVMSLARVIQDTGISRHNEAEYSPFHDFIATRKEEYPLWLATKGAWEFALAHLPRTARRAAVHYVIPRAQRLFRSR